MHFASVLHVFGFSCNVFLFKEELHPKPKLSMFCALSQNDQHFLEKECKHPETLPEKLENDTKILVGQVVLELLIKTVFCML